jgi:hypothetical protein
MAAVSTLPQDYSPAQVNSYWINNDFLNLRYKNQLSRSGDLVRLIYIAILMISH